MVAHFGAAREFEEFVAVAPAAVGAGELGVGEGGWGIEGLDFCAPVEGDSEEAELIVDEGAGVHGDGARSEDVEVEEGGGGVGEEREDFGSGARDEDGAVEVVGHVDVVPN